MNKYALGTIVGTALLGLAKTKGSSAKKTPLNKIAIHNMEIPIVIGLETIFDGYNALNPFDVPQEVINVWNGTPLLPRNGIQYRNLLITVNPYGMGGGTIGAIGSADGADELLIRKVDGKPFTYEEIDETWMIAKTVVQNEIYNRAVEALRKANIRWDVPYSLFMILTGWEFNHPPDILNLTTFGVDKQEYENWLENPYTPLDKMEPGDAPAQYRFYVSFPNSESNQIKLRKR